MIRLHEIRKEYNDEEYAEEIRDDESFDPISQTPKNSDDEGNGGEDLGLNVGGEEGHVKEEEEDELYKDSSSVSSQFVTSMLNPILDVGAAPPKPKASAMRTRSSSDTSINPLTAAASPRLTASAKSKQTAKASKAKSLSALFKVAMTEAQQLKLVTKRSMQQMHISQA
nr:hypothetical protein [Tanacetum cinerariifolium]